VATLQAGTFAIEHATLNLEGMPLAYWPYTVGEFRQSETALRRIRFAYSDDFGATAQSKWHLFNLLGLQNPEGVDGALRLDYFSERGPGIGTDIDYEQEDGFGLVRNYYIHDTGKDNLGPLRDGTLDSENRGRFTVRHRQYLPRDWELTLEASYICDPNFLEEYFNAESEEGKEQETLAYLKKQRDNWAFTGQAQWRVMDFQTQTERLPDLGFHWIGEPLAEIATLYSETHLGAVRYKTDDRRPIDSSSPYSLFRRPGDSDVTFRSETRQELNFPLTIMPINTNVVPFAVGRTGYWDGSPRDGSVDRQFGMLGLRASTQFWRVFADANSELLDINQVRHIIQPEVVSWTSASNRNSRDLYPFDESVEGIDDSYGTSLALRQRWQTRRGGPLGQGGTGQWRTVDWITFDVELNLFGNTPKEDLPIGRYYFSRPESSVAKNHIRTDFRYRISDTTTILSDGNIDVDDGVLDQFNLSYAVERTPRFSYFLGYRRIHDTDSNLFGVGYNYAINPKYRLAVRTYYDIERNRTESFDITVVRKFPRWYGAVTFAVDDIEDDFGLGFSVWPEGAPQAAIGSRRYTSLSESTGIRPEN